METTDLSPPPREPKHRGNPGCLGSDLDFLIETKRDEKIEI